MVPKIGRFDLHPKRGIMCILLKQRFGIAEARFGTGVGFFGPGKRDLGKHRGLWMRSVKEGYNILIISSYIHYQADPIRHALYRKQNMSFLHCIHSGLIDIEIV